MSQIRTSVIYNNVLSFTLSITNFMTLSLVHRTWIIKVYWSTCTWLNFNTLAPILVRAHKDIFILSNPYKVV